MIFFVCFALSLHAAIEASLFQVKSSGYCFLFAQIFEKKREFVGGCTSLCWSFIFIQFALSFVTFYITLFPFQIRHADWFKIKICFWTYTCAAITNAVIFTWGFYYVCNSLEHTPRCTDEAVFNLEFKYFTPKYVDGGRFVSVFFRIIISVWSNIFLWFLFCWLSFKNKHFNAI
ncbi:uncharacterized protein LOC124811140 isoform X1 [Hydra vulgaris]|uniref:uncharacterized protein LOC124811140 isoform X1 n=1 Tax=Hydra vulgaris TaxID=6087 RepID=UPI0002B4C25C|nr:uncharacterized protein LOC124811140 [Hydra vulgaris]